MPLQQPVTEILFARTSYVKKIIEDCSNSEETVKLLRFCCWENPQFSSTVLSELLWQVSDSWVFTRAINRHRYRMWETAFSYYGSQWCPKTARLQTFFFLCVQNKHIQTGLLEDEYMIGIFIFGCTVPLRTIGWLINIGLGQPRYRYQWSPLSVGLQCVLCFPVRWRIPTPMS